MSNPAEQIKMLQVLLAEKVRELKGSDEEEKKEQATRKKMIDHLREALHRVSEQVVGVVDQAIKERGDPLSHLKGEISHLENRLQDKRGIWSTRTHATDTEKMREMV